MKVTELTEAFEGSHVLVEHEDWSIEGVLAYVGNSTSGWVYLEIGSWEAGFDPEARVEVTVLP